MRSGAGVGRGGRRYVYKDMKRKKAELPPADFRGKLFISSRRFFNRPIARLWKELKAEWRRTSLAKECPVTTNRQTARAVPDRAGEATP